MFERMPIIRARDRSVDPSESRPDEIKIDGAGSRPGLMQFQARREGERGGGGGVV